MNSVHVFNLSFNTFCVTCNLVELNENSNTAHKKSQVIDKKNMGVGWGGVTTHFTTVSLITKRMSFVSDIMKKKARKEIMNLHWFISKLPKHFRIVQLIAIYIFLRLRNCLILYLYKWVKLKLSTNRHNRATKFSPQPFYYHLFCTQVTHHQEISVILLNLHLKE